MGTSLLALAKSIYYINTLDYFTEIFFTLLFSLSKNRNSQGPSLLNEDGSIKFSFAIRLKCFLLLVDTVSYGSNFALTFAGHHNN